MSSEYERCLHIFQANESRNDNGCDANFDKSMCWSPINLGESIERRCPFKYCSEIEGCENIANTHFVSRYCDLEGSWEMANYNQCISVVNNYAHCIVGFCRVCPDVLRDLVISVSLTLSIVSVALLVAALILFSIFDSIQCRRLAIHKNLATAFVFRFAVLAVWTVVQSSNLFLNCTTFIPTPLMQYDWLCKMILWCVIYFQVASVMWMLIEGAYLCSRFTVFAMRHSDVPYYAYLLAGWGITFGMMATSGFPFVVVMAWTVIHEMKSREQPNAHCWLPYAQGEHLWILAGTMGTALIMNLIFLLWIVVILVQKLGTENAESRKIWSSIYIIIYLFLLHSDVRTIKATLLLVPLLGVSNIPLFYEPDEQSGAYMLGSAILQHSQGIFIAVLYCFLNSEIQNALKRQLSKVPFHFFMRRNHFETERTYVPESRHHANHKLGVPMGELNGASTAAAKPPAPRESDTSTTALIKADLMVPPLTALTPPPVEESTVTRPPPLPVDPLIPLEASPRPRPAFNPLMVGSIKSIDAPDSDHNIE